MFRDILGIKIQNEAAARDLLHNIVTVKPAKLKSQYPFEVLTLLKSIATLSLFPGHNYDTKILSAVLFQDGTLIPAAVGMHNITLKTHSRDTPCRKMEDVYLGKILKFGPEDEVLPTGTPLQLCLFKKCSLESQMGVPTFSGIHTTLLWIIQTTDFITVSQGHDYYLGVGILAGKGSLLVEEHRSPKSTVQRGTWHHSQYAGWHQFFFGLDVTCGKQRQDTDISTLLSSSKRTLVQPECTMTLVEKHMEVFHPIAKMLYHYKLKIVTQLLFLRDCSEHDPSCLLTANAGSTRMPGAELLKSFVRDCRANSGSWVMVIKGRVVPGLQTPRQASGLDSSTAEAGIHRLLHNVAVRKMMDRCTFLEKQLYSKIQP
ncbi:hypothetical protein Anapl_11868 [Anas platyrhynchos]|uniref:Uncharacterized protein n=1 Tax=Anas platyrhynchos TaxID=8839 RepID=R0LSA5_ANAPL|nr:hypothetical protein Anapl_11868 [Anas platyrhynchos]